MHRLLYLLLLLGLSGCLRAGFDGAGAGSRPDGPAIDRAGPDARGPDLSRDTAPPADAAPPCIATVDQHTLVLLTFEGSGSTVVDLVGKHDGTLVGSGVARVPGPPGCGNAVAFPGAVTDYLTIADSADWDLAQGSVDFWVRIDAPTATEFRGIVTRDADGHALPGHLSVWQLCDDGIAVRLQDDVDNSRYVRCSPPVTLGVWHHVGVNFGTGGLALFVDGVEAVRTDAYTTCMFALECGTSTEIGIAGNDNPWVVGASSHQSVEGQVTPISGGLQGAVDSFRVSNVRRSFAAAP